MRQQVLHSAHHRVDIVVAHLTEVSRAEAEVHRHGAAVTALVLEIIHAVLRAHLGSRHIGAGAAHELRWVELVTGPRIAARFSSVVRLGTLEAHEVSIAIQGEGFRVLQA